MLPFNGLQKMDIQNVSACMYFGFNARICQSWKPEFQVKQGKTLNIYKESAYIFVGLDGFLWHAENHETTHHH
jgi:hypothetical protein